MGKATQTKGVLAVKCNGCGTEMNIPTLKFYQAGGVLHSDFGGHCSGTFRTVDQRKPRTHKASRDRRPRGGQKG